MAGKLLDDEFLNNIAWGLPSTAKKDAIRIAGRLLVSNRYVNPGYEDSMIERELEHNTYLGFGVAIPHGNETSLDQVLKSGICIAHFPDTIDYNGESVTYVIGIACKEEDTIQELMQITDILCKPEECEKLLSAASKEEFIRIINENYLKEGEL